jgi:hypothetical protein
MFSIKLPRTRPEDPPYTVTVFPDGRGPSPTDVTTAQLVPPLRTELRVTDSVNGKSFDLGGFSPRTIEGKVVNANDAGQEKYRVVALGRWDANSPITEVSTVEYTTQTGAFSLRLSEGLPENSVVELEARPYGETAPTLRMNVTLNAPAITGRQLTAPTVGAVTRTPITVRGTESNGEVAGVVGARVTVRGSIPAPQPGASFSTYEAEGITDSNGLVELDLVGGPALAQSYRISVVPPAGAPVGVLFDQRYEGDPVLRLPDRIALSGKVRDAAGLPVEGVQVTVRPSLRFQWSFTDGPQAFVAAIPAASDVTGASGEYVVFVDPFLADGETDVWGYYDISYDASEGTPAWTEFDLEIPRDTTVSTLAIPELTLPDAAHIHGHITDSSGAIVEGAELKLFRTNVVGTALCAAVPHAPETCPIPALLLGRGASNGDGEFRLTLPR